MEGPTKILVLNAGSSSQKSCLYEFKAETLEAPPRRFGKPRSLGRITRARRS
jgi:acetate kinase